jgi:hypothetical protein
MVRRILGALLILIGLLGIALGAVGVVYVWRLAEDVTVVALEGLFLVSDTLEDMDRSLEVASTTLDGTTIAIDSLYITSFAIGDTLSNTQVTLNEMAALAEDQLPTSMEYSLAALDTVKETARVIDQLLRGLAQVGLGTYDPEIPLDEAVENAVTGLGPVPDSLRVMGDGLHQTGRDMEGVQQGFTLMIDSVMEIRENLIDADAAIAAHQGTVQDLQERVDAVTPNVAQPIQAVAWGVTLLLFWIGLSQLAILRWGISLWEKRAPVIIDQESTESQGTD